MAQYYAEGNLIRIQATFRDGAGAVIDPTGVGLSVERPISGVVTYNYPADITKDGVGIYSKILDTTGEPGEWFYRWFSTGVGQAATTEYKFTILEASPS